jgi:hypothetical protein
MRGQGAPADIGTFQSPCSVMVYQYTFSGTTYICAARQGDRGWVLVDYGLVAVTVLQSAVNAVAGNGTVFIKKGQYSITSTLTVDVTVLAVPKYVTLEGESGATLVKAAGNFPVINITSTHLIFSPDLLVTLKNLIIDSVDHLGVGIQFNAVDRLTLEHVITKNIGMGINGIDSVFRVDIIDCDINGNDEGAVFDHVCNIYAVGSLFRGVSDNAIVLVNRSDVCTFIGNMIVGSVRGLNIMDSQGTVVQGCLFEVNTTAVSLSGASYPPTASFIGNQFAGNTTDVNASTGDSLFEGNIFFAAPVLILTAGTTRWKDNIGYNPKGNVATPYPVAAGYIRDTAAAQAFPTSATNYTISESPKLITIYGGTVTSISIDGVVCGLTSGAFRLEPRQVLNVVWTGQPSSVVYAQ